ncbi:hypothetical protein BWQ96_03949 [Gracilariopsis chorda]|uniref:Uncharacterized protein n=1 Tax=Gracilariopsis chorda TaxID=448386 RepID=A0A2V3IW44_9FLOR|nr:hypothetical protein BWQ96_03949 [Gracilariopsis chorda]|eukprot:PXF46293.1 hypothetical protein BWQ96_03949 [Gracilariopsis chorda]
MALKAAALQVETLEECLSDLPNEEPRGFLFEDGEFPPDYILFIAALVVLVVTVVDITVFFHTKRRLRFFFLFLFTTFVALTVVWFEHVMEAIFAIRDIAKDIRWVRTASKCYKSFGLIERWYFQPWMPLFADICRIIATGLESLVILLSIVQDFCVRRRLSKKKFFICIAVIGVSGGLAACIMIRTRIDVYGCRYELDVDRYTCRMKNQSYSKTALSSGQVNICDAKTESQVKNPAAISRLTLGQEDPGRNIPTCGPADEIARKFGRYSRHTLLNQFFSEAATISGVFLAILLLAIVFELYIVAKTILFRKDISFVFLMLTLGLIVLKDLYPLISDIRKLHDKTESRRLLICGCSLEKYDRYKQALNDSVWELVVLLLIIDVAVTFSKEIDRTAVKYDDPESANDNDVVNEESNSNQGTGDELDADQTRPAAGMGQEEGNANEKEENQQKNQQDVVNGNDVERFVSPPTSLRPRHLKKFFKDVVSGYQNDGFQPDSSLT